MFNYYFFSHLVIGKLFVKTGISLEFQFIDIFERNKYKNPEKSGLFVDFFSANI